ncbi:MAG: 2-amino-4-hydroxy-6-hydroxymethyldihydropteridine diphosphokinase [Anaerolineae bacterium]
MADQIHIKDLLLRTIIGINRDEREKRQDVLINITLSANTRPAGRSDEIEDAVNYKTITKRVIRMVEASSFYLVERMVDEIAAICLADPRVEGARIRVEKPGALRFARSVGVEIYRTRADLAEQPNRAFITLGSNIDPVQNMTAAVGLLKEQVTIRALSPVYETAPVGKTDQPDFLNAAALIETQLPAQHLKETVLSPIEQALHRVRTEDKNAPRTIDLDIALYNYDVLDFNQHHIPDPDIISYRHIALPLADLAPYHVHPETGETLSDIAARMSRDGIRLRPDVELQAD